MKEDLEKPEPQNEKEVNGDVVSMLKSLHYLQQENKKLEGQIQTLSTKKKELELTRAQLSVPFTSVPTSSEVRGDAARTYTPQIYPCVTQIPSAPPPPYAMPMMTFEGGEVRGPNGQTGTVIGGIADARYISIPTTTQAERAQTEELQPYIGGGTQEGPAAAGSSTSPAPEFTEVNLERAQNESRHCLESGGRCAVSHPDTPLIPATEEMTSPGDEIKRTAFLDLPTPRIEGHFQPSKAKSAKKDQWHGEVHGEMHEAYLIRC